MTKVLHILTPIVTEDLYRPEHFADLLPAGVTLTMSAIEAGPMSIESAGDEAEATPHILKSAVLARDCGADAIVIDCFGDPALQPLREILDIPVFGPGVTSLHLAAMLAHRFAVITMLPSVVPLIHEMARRAGLHERLAKVGSVNLPVLELHADESKLQRLLASEAMAAIESGAEAIILGCTGMFGTDLALAENLKRSTGVYIPVIDPIRAVVAAGATALQMGLGHSRLTYPRRDESHSDSNNVLR